MAELAQETMRFHSKAFPELTGKRLEHMGFVKARPKGEEQSKSQKMTKLLNKEVKINQYDHEAVYQEKRKGRKGEERRKGKEEKKGGRGGGGRRRRNNSRKSLMLACRGKKIHARNPAFF